MAFNIKFKNVVYWADQLIMANVYLTYIFVERLIADMDELRVDKQ